MNPDTGHGFGCISSSQSCMWPSARNRSQPRLAQLKPASSASTYFCRSSMRACCSAVGESCGGAPGPLPAPLPSSICASTLFNCLVGDLLLQAGNLGLRIQFAQARAQLRDLHIVLLLRLLGLDPRAQRVGSRCAQFGVKPGIKDRNLDGETGAEVVGGKRFQRIKVTLDVVQQRRVAVVNKAEADFGQQP